MWALSVAIRPARVPNGLSTIVSPHILRPEPPSSVSILARSSSLVGRILGGDIPPHVGRWSSHLTMACGLDISFEKDYDRHLSVTILLLISYPHVAK
jgi:hypothetical protein